MEFDFCLVASWSDQSSRQMVTWAREFADRGARVAVLSLTPLDVSDDPDVEGFTLAEFVDGADETPSPATVESRYDIPSLDHLSFTERLYFGLSRTQALERTTRVASALEAIFSEHSVDNSLQVRGPEIHRQLVHYVTESQGGASIWADFSPFDGTFALTTALDGSWDGYRTVPFEELSDRERSATETHMDEFRERRRFYAHDEGDEGDDDRTGPSVVDRVRGTIDDVVDRDRPGRIRDQVGNELKLRVNRTVNGLQYPSLDASRRRCEATDYVFFPLQYPIESRLTVFSPQFYRQEFLVEYLSRALPSSISLFVKAHPNHPGRPAPGTVRELREDGRVEFLHPELNAHEVIENSEGVVVVNNTVGYETLYYRKPLFTLGTAPYSETPAATPVEDLGALPEVLADGVSTTVPRSTAVASVHSLREASYDGDRASYEEENVRALVDSVLTFVDDEPWK